MSPNSQLPDDVRSSVTAHLQTLYPDHDVELLISRIVVAFAEFTRRETRPATDLWSQRECLLITYGDSIASAPDPPLSSLQTFLDEFAECFSVVHILPFSPFSSDDGFAVVDYDAINPQLGEWQHLEDLARDRRLMADLVLNHISSESVWFQNYVNQCDPGAGYFVEIGENDDISQVVRPRTSPLMRPTMTTDGLRQLWCTFSHDQVDLNFRNPDVLLEFLSIIRRYLEHGVTVFRLDAIGFLWKTPGTASIHLPETHEVVRLLRTIVDHYAPGTLMVTETNVPNHENLSYFGNRNEAHIVYNFSLAPLLVHALLTGNVSYLKRWMMMMPPAPAGCTYLNFTASHDGIGMRPAEGLLSEQEQAQLVDTVVRFGGLVSTRRSADGGERVYELNISLFDAMKGTVDGEDDWQIERFLCSQTVMMGIEGIPAIYIHSLLATPNDTSGVRQTGRNRSINRRQLDLQEVRAALSDTDSVTSRVYNELMRRLTIRCGQPAFHPNATQFTLQLGDSFFAFWRQSADREQSIFAVHNMSSARQELRLADLNLISLDAWTDLLSAAELPDLDGSLQVQPYQCLWITNVTPTNPKLPATVVH